MQMTAVCSFFPSYRSMISQALGNFFIMLSSNEEAIIASITASQEIISQMTGAGDLSAELETGVANLDRVFKNHLSEYNVLLMPIVAEFKTASLQFRDMATPRVNVLREAFNRNLAETVKALNSVFHTILKMAVNFRTAVDMYVEEYRRSMQEFYRTIENLSPEERERRKREMETIVQEILTKFQKLYEVASGAAPAS